MEVGIKASVGSYDGNPIEFDGVIILPMQSIRMETVSVEQHLDFYPGGNTGPSVKSTYLMTSVKDGQNNPIRRAPLIYNTNRGQFTDEDDTPTDIDSYPYTGQTGYDGINKKKITVSKYECNPSPQPPIPQDTAVDVIVTILGYNTQSTCSIIARRFD